MSSPLFVIPRHDLLLREYEDATPALSAFGDALSADLALWLAEEPQLKVHSVTLRLKSRESLAKKLGRPDRSYDELWDFEDAVDRVAKVLESRLQVALEHSIDKRRRGDSSAFGYRSLHYVCRIDGSRCQPDGARHAPLPRTACFEVQVRTVLEHAWAEIEHDLGYKARDVVPAAARRRLSRLAGLLELADQEFIAIRSELESYSRSLPRRIETGAESVSLDRLSLAALLDCAEVREVDLAIAGALGKDLGDDPFFPAYLLKMLARTGVHTVQDARVGVRDHASTIVSMVQPYFAFAFRAWSLSPEQMQQIARGYSLFFLAHAAVLKASTLRIDKVARLTQLYRELDYPDDERAAQHVASMLVDAFGGVV